MDGIRVEVTGTDAILRALQQAGRKGMQAATAAFYQEAERIMTDSKEHYVPVHDAILKGSGHVQPPQVTGGHLSVTLGYGGAASAYALAVHEHLSQHSPPSWKAAEAAGRPVTFHPPGRGPKFLELPLLAAERGFSERIAAGIRRAMGRS